MNEMDQTKHQNCLDIYNPAFDTQPKIVIVGAGGIGCGTTFALAQMGFNDITVVDFDEVELKNTSSQLYKESDIGLSKVTALQTNVQEFTGIVIKTQPYKFEPSMVKDADIVIMAVDDMEVRKQIAESLTTKTKRMIDCRMAGTYFHMFNYIPVYELPIYMTTWYSNEQASPVTCTNKSSSFNTFVIAGFITRFVVGIVKEDPIILNKSQLTVDLQLLMIT